MSDNRRENTARDAYAMLVDVGNKIQALGDAYIGEVTMRQYMALCALERLNGDNATLNDLAQGLYTSKQNAKQLVNALAAKGYIALGRNRYDRRAVHITLTPEGEAALERSHTKSSEFLKEAFYEFDDAELDAFVNTLLKLYGFDGEGHRVLEKRK